MKPDRAYARISAGAALLGNAWLERSWSAFVGNTFELRQKAGDFAWVAGNCPEFRIAAQNRVFGVMDLGDLEWSEVYTPFGAGLMARKSGPGLLFVIGSFALHENPGMLRSTRIMNTSTDPIVLDHVALDVLSIAHAAIRVRTHRFAREQAALAWQTEESAAALLLENRGLILGILGGGLFQLFQPQPGCCALVVPNGRTLEPGQVWTLPDAFLLPFTGDPDRAVSTLFGDFLLQVRQMKAWETQIDAARQTPQN